MFNVTIKDSCGSKSYSVFSVEFLNYIEDRAFSRVVLYSVKNNKVFKNMLFLEPGDEVFVEVLEKNE